MHRMLIFIINLITNGAVKNMTIFAFIIVAIFIFAFIKILGSPNKNRNYSSDTSPDSISPSYPGYDETPADHSSHHHHADFHSHSTDTSHHSSDPGSSFDSGNSGGDSSW
jgi:hypothetical protein